MELSGLGREERRFIDKAAMLGTTFGLRDLHFESGNTSLIAKLLIERGFLIKADKSIGIYTFHHTAMRIFLRYASEARLIDVFSDDRFLV